MIKFLAANNPMSEMIMPGQIIWRRINLFDGSINDPPEIKFHPGEKGGYFARMSINRRTDFIDEFVCVEHEEKGIRILLDELPPDNFTHLIVKGVSRVMREASNEGGGLVFAQAVEPIHWKTYCDWRGEVLRLLQESNSGELEDLWTDMHNSWIMELPQTVHRLFCHPIHVKPRLSRLEYNYYISRHPELDQKENQ